MPVKSLNAKNKLGFVSVFVACILFTLLFMCRWRRTLTHLAAAAAAAAAAAREGKVIWDENRCAGVCAGGHEYVH
jgi:hypothetical protein